MLAGTQICERGYFEKSVSSARICNQEKVLPNLCATELLRSNAIGPRMAEHAIHPESISSLNPEEVAEWDAGEPALPYSPEESPIHRK